MNVTGSLALPGFFLSGFLLALLGALLPAWGYHLDPRYAAASQYFLCTGAGVITAGFSLRTLLSRVRATSVLSGSCGLASAALLFLSLANPPAPEYFRLAGWAVIGVAGGLLNGSLFEVLVPVYRDDPAATVNLGGVFFGLGCLASALLVAGTFYLYSITVVLVIFASVPLLFALLYHCRYSAVQPTPGPSPALRVFRDFLSPGAILFALLLFFETGNEWTLAGWLPLFLIRHLGMSPVQAVWLLSLYWCALLIGRVVSVYLLAKIRHSRLLLSSAASALFGCLLLAWTGNLLGTVVGILFSGAGFAVIYPLVMERIGGRFPDYHPGVFNSIFSVALAGGMLAPGMVGWLADSFGLWVVMGLPALGTLMVVILLLLIWLESKVTGR